MECWQTAHQTIEVVDNGVRIYIQARLEEEKAGAPDGKKAEEGQVRVHVKWHQA